jgi:TolB-like protein
MWSQNLSFFEELKRRNVFRVAVLYFVASWLIMQVADVMFPALNLPEWTITLVVALLVIGFPLALLLSWIYELTPQGVKKEKDVDRSQSVAGITGQKLNYAIIVFLSGALAVSIIANYFLDDPLQEPSSSVEQVDTPQIIPDEPTVNPMSVAVLPFLTITDDAEARQFADGLAEEILNELAGIEGLNVASRTSSFQYRNSDKDASAIGRELNVAFVLEGSVRRVESNVRFTAQLIRVEDGFHVWSETFDRATADSFSVQTELGRDIARFLNSSMGTEGLIAFLRATTDNDGAVAYFAKGMREQNHIRDGGVGDWAVAAEYFNKAIELDPNFASPYLHLGDAYANRLGNRISYIEASPLAHMAANRYIEIRPQEPEGYAFRAGILGLMDLNYLAAREAISHARSIDPSNGYVFLAQAHLDSQMGRLNEAIASYRRVLARSPGSANLWDWVGSAMCGQGD